VALRQMNRGRWLVKKKQKKTAPAVKRRKGTGIVESKLPLAAIESFVDSAPTPGMRKPSEERKKTFHPASCYFGAALYHAENRLPDPTQSPVFFVLMRPYNSIPERRGGIPKRRGRKRKDEGKRTLSHPDLITPSDRCKNGTIVDHLSSLSATLGFYHRGALFCCLEVRESREPSFSLGTGKEIMKMVRPSCKESGTQTGRVQDGCHVERW